MKSRVRLNVKNYEVKHTLLNPEQCRITLAGTELFACILILRLIQMSPAALSSRLLTAKSMHQMIQEIVLLPLIQVLGF